MVQFNDLSDDVVLLIADAILGSSLPRPGEKDLSALSRTCRRFYNLLDRYLYRQHIRRSSSWAVTWAAEHDRVDTLRKLIDAGADVTTTATNHGRNPAVLVAARHGSVAVTRLLLAMEGVDPDWKCDRGAAPLSWAASGGHAEVVELLLADPRVDPNSVDIYKRSALSYASEHHQSETVSLLLLDGRADPTLQNVAGRTALSLAVDHAQDNSEVINMLLADPRTDPFMVDNNGKNALHWAAIEGCVKNIQPLLDRGLDVNTPDGECCTPIHWALHTNILPGRRTDGLELLLCAAGADPNAVDWAGLTPLMYGIIAEAVDLVQVLVADPRVDVNIADRQGKTALVYAVAMGSSDCVRALLQADSLQVNYVSPQGGGFTPLHFAADGGWEAALKVLRADKRLDTKPVTNIGASPARYAATNGHLATLKVLIDDGRFSILEGDRFGRTPMSYAADSGYDDIVRTLLELARKEGVECDTPDDQGMRPSDYAEERGHKGIARLLREGVSESGGEA